MLPRSSDDIPVLTGSEQEILRTLPEEDHRLLLFGPPGIGKSTLASRLGQALVHKGRQCLCICADPGSPAFGIPGAVSLGRWTEEGWLRDESIPLCSLDAGRFRLPLIQAVRKLARKSCNGMLLIDGPGVVRGVAGAELLDGIVDAASVDAVIALTSPDRSPPLLNQLRALDLKLFVLHAGPEGKAPGKRARARHRTELWDAYLADAIEHSIDIGTMNLLGTPPPQSEESAWIGRLIAVSQGSQNLAVGEVDRLEGNRLIARFPAGTKLGDTLLVRDALRTPQGLIETAVPFVNERIEYLPPAGTVPGVEESGGARVIGQVGSLEFELVNGVFGDSLLHLRLRHQRRSLLFDLGDGARLPARIAHQVSDVFISHAHMDHIGGFQWFLRSRLSRDVPVCRLYGPPGLVNHILGFLQCFIWDRIGVKGPVFEVAELHRDRLRRFRIQVGGADRLNLEDLPVVDGVVHEEPGFRIRTVVLDHRTPVIAYAFEPDSEITVRRERLIEYGLEPGPWLGTLKKALLAGNRNAKIALPNGTEEFASKLGNDLLVILPQKKLVYATDFADTPENRARITGLARHAHTFLCESTFRESDREKARMTGHLTTRACGEIATSAEVARLVPFHFSRRYSDAPGQMYEEIASYCSRVVTPKNPLIFESV